MKGRAPNSPETGSQMVRRPECEPELLDGQHGLAIQDDGDAEDDGRDDDGEEARPDPEAPVGGVGAGRALVHREGIVLVT